MPTGFTTTADEHLIRSEIWSSQLKDVLLDELIASSYVRLLTDFPDGETFTIPSIGEFAVDDYTEDEAVKYRAFDTGEFQFTITEYISAATYITDKHKQDSFYMNDLVSSFVPKQQRAIMQRYEADVFSAHVPGKPNGQTVSDPNTINGGQHRFVAGGTNQVIELDDFAKAKFSLKKANVPLTNLIAVVDPSVGFTLETLTNLTNVSNNPRWEGIIETGLTTGMRFIKNVYGFDVWESNYLPDNTGETINSVTLTSGKENLFFSAAPDVLPIVAAWRQMPRVESERNKDRQRDEFVTTARYGVKLFRPENIVAVLSDDTQVFA